MSSPMTWEKELSNQDPEVRRQTVVRLAEAPSKASAPLVLRALGDDDWRVRKEAVSAARLLSPDPEFLKSLVASLRAVENVGLRNAAVEALGAFGAEAVDVLAIELPNLDADARKLAAEVLGATGHRSALTQLDALIDDEDPNVQAAAAEAAARLGSAFQEAALPLLRRALGSSERIVRLAALDGLNQLRAPLDWISIEGLLGDPIMEKAALCAAGRSTHENGGRVLTDALRRARDSGFADVLRYLAEYASASESNAAAASDRLKDFGTVEYERILHELTASKPELRRAALVLATLIPPEHSASRVAELLTDDEVAGDAQDALAWMGEPGLAALIGGSEQAEPIQRAQCIRLLGRFLDREDAPERAVRAVVEGLSHHSEVVVEAAVETLGIIGDASSLLRLSDLLGDARVALRNAANHSFRMLVRRFPAAAKSLVADVHPLGARALTATLVLVALGAEQASAPVYGSPEGDVSFLTHAMAHPDARVRCASLEALSGLPDERALQAAVFALSDEEQSVRMAAVRALGLFRNQEGAALGVDHLLDLVQAATDEGLLSAAVQALGDAGDIRALRHLRSLIRGSEPLLAVAAVQAMGRLRGARRLEALIDAIGHSDTEVVKSALLALAHESDPRVNAHLAACVDHSAWDVRRLAADLLGRRASEDSLELLRAKLLVEEEPLVRDAIQQAIQMALAPPSDRPEKGDDAVRGSPK